MLCTDWFFLVGRSARDSDSREASIMHMCSKSCQQQHGFPSLFSLVILSFVSQLTFHPMRSDKGKYRRWSDRTDTIGNWNPIKWLLWKTRPHHVIVGLKIIRGGKTAVFRPSYQWNHLEEENRRGRCCFTSKLTPVQLRYTSCCFFPSSLSAQNEID